MATVPVSGTNIRLLSNIPFHSDYKNTRWFDSLSEQTTYFKNKTPVHTIEQANFQRVEGRTFIKVDKSVDQLRGVNYLMFRNTEYNNKWFYAFVTQLEYKQKMTTYVHFQLDVFQTWKFEMDFKPSYVNREHRPLWNSDGTPVINTLDEGLNYGLEYETVNTTYFEPNNGYRWMVIVMKERVAEELPDKEIDPRIIGAPQPLVYYIVPFNQFGVSATIKSGTEYINCSNPTHILKRLYEDVANANNIVNIYVTEHIGAEVAFTNDPTYADTFVMPLTVDVAKLDVDPDATESAIVGWVRDFPQFSGQEIQIESDKYSGFESVTESKLLMYPYSLTIVDDFKGNRITLKNEYINSASLDIIIKGSIGVSNYVTYNIKNYNYSGSVSEPEKLSNETSLVNRNPSDLPILTDMLSAYIQGNKNSLENRESQIKTAGVKNLIDSGIGAVSSLVMRNPAGVVQGMSNAIMGSKQKQLELQAINAKQQDIDNVPPQMSKMGSNTAYNYGHDYNGLMIIKKQLKSEYRKKLEDYFKMYGYKTLEIKMPNFHTRENWNYVQTEDCNIYGNFNHEDLQELRSIFDNGITLWHTDDIGNYSLSNGVI